MFGPSCNLPSTTFVSAGATYVSRFLVGPQPDDLVGQLALLDDPIGRDEESVVVDAGVDRQARDQTDVRTFRRLDRTDATVVRDVHVADFKASPFAVQTTGTQGRQTPLVRQLRQRVGLVDDLGQFAATEEVLDGRRDALGIDQAARRHVGRVLQAHALLHGAAQLQEALAQFVAGQFVNRPQAAVAQVVDVVDLGAIRSFAQLQQVGDRRDQVLRAQRHFLLGDAQLEFPIDAEPADAAQAIAVDVVELLVEQRLGLLQLRRVARAQSLVDPQQRFLVARGRVVGQAIEDQRRLGGGHHFDLGHAGGADRLGSVLGDLLARLDNDLAGPLAAHRIDDVVHGDLAHDFRGAAAVDDLLVRRRIERPDDVRIGAVLRRSSRAAT